jgi:alpha-amylase
MHTLGTLFALHNHQPIGNFDSVIEEAWERSYSPFLTVLARHPDVRFTQHWTGTLLEWLIRRHPETVELLRTLVQRGQLELLTGAYYEAVLAVIPPADRVGQIRKLTALLERTFGVQPRGMWLAERVWEQSLVTDLAAAGVEFVLVDDTHFKHAGLRDDQLLGYYTTEDGGAILRVFPIDKTLRYTVPFRPLEETLHYLRSTASGGAGRVVVNADDGEKFGVWPKTHAHVYDNGWLESFCRMLEAERPWLHTLHFGEVLDGHPPTGHIYLPAASYAEMMKWALPAASFTRLDAFERRLQELHLLEEHQMFVRGGYWRNFLAKYPESNHMHKKMLRVAAALRDASARGPLSPGAQESLWAGQCNDPLWHGVFGGLYLPNLRFPVYRSLLEAEAAADRAAGPRPVRVVRTDFDCDGREDLLLESDVLNLYFTPATGASLVELDHKPLRFNLLDIVSRREEGYHRRLREMRDHGAETPIHDGVLAKEAGLEHHLHFDWYRRASLVDHFFGPGTTPEAFRTGAFHEVGDFVNQPYTAEVGEEKGETVIRFRREGALWYGPAPHRLTVEKTIRYRDGADAFTVGYLLVNGEAAPVDVWFGVEFNAGLLAGDAHDRYYTVDGVRPPDPRLRSAGQHERAREVRCTDEWLGLEAVIRSDEPTNLWRCPVETVSLSEAGFERLYQSSTMVFHRTFRLGRTWSTRFTHTLRPLVSGRSA